jgi:phosphoglycolate phosphatase-like HAD superfamily hydrolase
LSGEFDALALHLLSLTGGRCLEVVEVLQDELLDVAPQLRREGDGPVLLFDELLDQLDRRGLALAIGDPAGAA